MKRFVFALICLVAVMTAASCKSETAADIAALDAAKTVLESQPDVSLYTQTLSAFDGVYDYAENVYGVDKTMFSDAAVIHAEGMDPHEIAVFREDHSRGGEDRYEISCLLLEYLKRRTNDFSGYAPAAAATVARAEVVTSDDGYVLLLICDDVDAAKAAFNNAVKASLEAASYDKENEGSDEPLLDENGYVVFNDSELNELPIYDTSDILKAYFSGDESSLSTKDKAILKAAKEIISAIITEDMSDYEKEHAVHDYIVTHTYYDEDAITAAGDPDSANPYGLLIKGKATCMGYASSFSLFMDMLGIENAIVLGAHEYSTEEHAWNMVRLESDWYCVDVTWDDPIGAHITEENIHDDTFVMNMAHRYFNVTSEYMRDTDHQWDYYGVPEADGTKFAFDEFN